MHTFEYFDIRFRTYVHYVGLNFQEEKNSNLCIAQDLISLCKHLLDTY